MILLICGIGRAGKSTYSEAFEDVIHFDLMGRMAERYRNINEIVSHKDDAVVEYALSSSLSPAMVADYTLQLPDKQLLEAKLRELTLLTEGTEDE